MKRCALPIGRIGRKLMKRYKVLSVVLGAGAAIGLMAVPAGAVPKGGATLSLECDALGSVEIATTPPDAEWTPGFVVGSNQRLTPYAFRLESGGDVIEFSKPGPRNGRLDHCTFTVEDENGVINGEVWLSYTPAS
jgi:hypothetical protein